MDEPEARRLLQEALKRRAGAQGKARAKAEAEIARIRAQIEAEIEHLAAQLRAALRARPNAESPGSPERPVLMTLRRRIEELNQLHGLDSVEAGVGGADEAMLTPLAVPAPMGEAMARRKLPAVGLLAIVVAGVVLVAFLVSRVMGLGGEVACEISRTSDASLMLDIVVRNAKPVPVTLWAPWVAGRPSGGGGQCGLLVFVREQADGAWRVLPDQPGCWLRRGERLAEPLSFTLEPGFSMELKLDLGALLEKGVSPQAVRVALTTGGGRVVRLFDVDLK